MTKETPSLYEWAGGQAALERLTTRFYERLAEVLGGPTDYSTGRGGHPHMVSRHLGRHLTPDQRTRWMALLLDTADEVGLPDDPEFRSAFVGYIEWGSRLAVINSQPGAAADPDAPMPRWGWGEVGGPYVKD